MLILYNNSISSYHYYSYQRLPG